MWIATRSKGGGFDTNNGTTGIEAQLMRCLAELTEEERTDPIQRNKIFKEVVGENGHGHVLLGGVGVRPVPKRSSLSSSWANDNQQQELTDSLREHINSLREQIRAQAVKIEEKVHQYDELSNSFQEQINAQAALIEEKDRQYKELQDHLEEKDRQYKELQVNNDKRIKIEGTKTELRLFRVMQSAGIKLPQSKSVVNDMNASNGQNGNVTRENETTTRPILAERTNKQ